MKISILVGYTLFLTALLLTNDPWKSIGGEWVMQTAPDPSDFWTSVSLHLASYSILGVLIFWNGFGVGVSAWVVRLGILHGLTTEVLQGFVPKRFTNLDDMVANTLGVCLGFYGLRWWVQRHGKNAAAKMALPVGNHVPERSGKVD